MFTFYVFMIGCARSDTFKLRCSAIQCNACLLHFSACMCECMFSCAHVWLLNLCEGVAFQQLACPGPCSECEESLEFHEGVCLYGQDFHLQAEQMCVEHVCRFTCVGCELFPLHRELISFTSREAEEHLSNI